MRPRKNINLSQRPSFRAFLGKYDIQIRDTLRIPPYAAEFKYVCERRWKVNAGLIVPTTKGFHLRTSLLNDDRRVAYLNSLALNLKSPIRPKNPLISYQTRDSTRFPCTSNYHFQTFRRITWPNSTALRHWSRYVCTTF